MQEIKTTLSGIPVKFTNHEIVVAGVSYRFTSEFEEEVVYWTPSISGHFISVINSSGELFLITLGDVDSLYVDQITSNRKFKYTQFTCNETILIGLTDNNIIQFYKVLLPEFLSEFNFDFDNIATEFEIMEANGILRISNLVDGVKRHKCFYIPENYRDSTGITPLVEADDSYCSLFEPELPKIEQFIEEKEVEQDDGLGELPQKKSLEEAAQILLAKNEQLHRKQQELINRRNALAQLIRDLKQRGDNIQRREDAVRKRATGLYYRIQKLIESRENSAEVDRLSDKFTDAEKTLRKLNLEDLNAEADPTIVAALRACDFPSKLDRIEKEINSRIEQGGMN